MRFSRFAPGLMVCAAGFMTAAAQGQMRITEYMYQGGSGEFIEFTNIGNSPINMTGWSFDDDSRTAGSTSLSAFGIVPAHKSVILAELPAATFIANWNLSGVSVIGNNANNLGRNDEINLYDNSSALVDRLTYGDQTFSGTIRTNNTSGWTTVPNLGTNSIASWQYSFVGDVNGSHVSAAGDIASPGVYVPEPATISLLVIGVFAARRRSR